MSYRVFIIHLLPHHRRVSFKRTSLLRKDSESHPTKFDRGDFWLSFKLNNIIDCKTTEPTLSAIMPNHRSNRDFASLPSGCLLHKHLTLKVLKFKTGNGGKDDTFISCYQKFLIRSDRHCTCCGFSNGC